MLDQILTNHRPLARQKIDDARRKRDLLHKLDELRGYHRRIVRRLDDDGITGRNGGRCHPGEYRQWKVPGWYNDADTKRNVLELVDFVFERRLG